MQPESMTRLPYCVDILRRMPCSLLSPMHLLIHSSSFCVPPHLPPHAFRSQTTKHLGREIQQPRGDSSVGLPGTGASRNCGHSPTEDAHAAMDLAALKLQRGHAFGTPDGRSKHAPHLEVCGWCSCLAPLTASARSHRVGGGYEALQHSLRRAGWQYWPIGNPVRGICGRTMWQQHTSLPLCPTDSAGAICLCRDCSARRPLLRCCRRTRRTPPHLTVRSPSRPRVTPWPAPPRTTTMQCALR